MNAGALTGLRVADLTIITAGASATQILADLGAEVFKVESASYPDPFRNWGGLTPPELSEPWNMSPPFSAVNRNKYGITLDLKHPLGHAACLRLVAYCDVVAENFRRGVMDRLGLGYAALQRVRPDLVMVSLSSQGASGPEASYGSFGSTLDALSGLMSMTGYDPDTPTWSSNEVNYPDQVVSLFGAAAIMLGVRERRRTGRGMYIDLAQRELVTSMLGETILDFTVNRRVAEPRANRDRSMVPHGVYACRGDDAWLAIAVRDDTQWKSLCRAMACPQLADDPSYATLVALRARSRDRRAYQPVDRNPGQTRRDALPATTRRTSRRGARRARPARGSAPGGPRLLPDGRPFRGRAAAPTDLAVPPPRNTSHDSLASPSPRGAHTPGAGRTLGLHRG